MKLPSHLAGSRGLAVPTQHRVVGHLHDEKVVVDQRPSALHLARLELVGEGAQVGVPEQAAVAEGLVARGTGTGRAPGGAEVAPA